jgi:hypothetical protein
VKKNIPFNFYWVTGSHTSKGAALNLCLAMYTFLPKSRKIKQLDENHQVVYLGGPDGIWTRDA